MKGFGFIIFISAVVMLCSCRSTKKIQEAINKKDTVIVNPVPVINPHDDSISFIKDNYRLILNNRINFKTFSAKVDIDYEDASGKKNNVNAHIRMYKDSVIWVSVTGILGIEGLRALITADSVKLLDKQNKIYIPRSVSYLQEVTALPLDLSSLQDLLLGNPVFLDSNIVSYSRTPNTISLLSNGDFFKNLFTIGESDKLMYSCKLDDLDGFRNRTCYLTYVNYENKKGCNFPTERTISVSEKKKLDLKLEFRQYDFNETLSFPFNIPKNYTRN
ncbi:MAG: DUF4292 domain-containing protein [Sphingobacteriales bacterium]|nr:DUF4292 domain-containing protein [Sphingobacteriales bacterium]